MCGIIGILSKEIDKEELKRATKLLSYRGPDAYGYYFDKNVALGHRRLSIIDLSKKAKQPMANKNETLWIVYNGEIYNFKELREDLEKKYDFKSNSDTEVILHAYEEYGEKCVEKLNGMFAFAIWNSKDRSLFLARDRAGIKPLYFFKDNEKFVFSSEIKGLFEFGIEKELNKEVLYDYFNYQTSIGSETLFKNIFSFPPGHYAIARQGGVIIKKYWSPEYNIIKADERYYSSRLKMILEDSVERQMVSDVPVGTFLSGGLDSSVITALASKFSEKKLKTFTAGFDVYPEEIENAEFASREIGTEQHSVTVDSGMFVKALPELVWHYDSPISFASSVPLHFVSKLAKKKVKVILTGEGADELFAGYRRYYLIQKTLGINNKLGFLTRNGVPFKIAEKMLYDPRYIKMMNLLLNGANYDYFTGINSIIGDERKKLLKVERNHILREKVRGIFNEKNTNFTNKLLYLDFRTYLQELLTKQDRMSMAASIESRVPFLDNKVIAFANSIPPEMKLNGKIGKYILRKSIKTILPESILKKKKIGFTVPLDKWFRKDLSGYIHEELNNKTVHEFFNKKYVDRLLDKQKSHNCSLQLWTILNFKLWHERFFSD